MKCLGIHHNLCSFSQSVLFNHCSHMLLARHKLCTTQKHLTENLCQGSRHAHAQSTLIFRTVFSHYLKRSEGLEVKFSQTVPNGP